MCELLVGLPDVNVLGIDEQPGLPLQIRVETKLVRVGCPTCGSFASVKDRPEVALIDLPSFGRPTRLIWYKRRWCCPDADCEKAAGPRTTGASPLRVWP
jgi:transposase